MFKNGNNNIIIQGLKLISSIGTGLIYSIGCITSGLIIMGNGNIPEISIIISVIFGIIIFYIFILSINDK